MKFFWKYIYPALFGLLIYITIRLVNDFTAGARFWTRPWYTTAIELFFTLFTSYIIQYMLRYYIHRFNAQPALLSPKRVIREFGIIYGWLFIIINVINMPVTALTDDGLSVADFVIAHIIPALYVFIYYSIARGNHYVREYINQQVRMEKIQNDQLQTELKFLKAQYHPHFLFNALNTIYFQMDENVAEAKKSVEQFSELLRYQLYDQQQTVSASQEMDYLKTFIGLQKIRSSDKLKLSVYFDPSINGQQVYPLLFLPLVENAFKYVGGHYLLRIEASLAGNCIRLLVQNSVPTDPQSVQAGKGIGLENLERRLKLLYPGKHYLSSTKENDRYTALLEINTSKD